MIDPSGVNIYFIDAGLQEVVHVYQIMVVWGTKDKMSFKEQIKTGRRAWWLTRCSLFINHNEIILDHTPPGSHSKQIELKVLCDAVKMPLDAGPGLRHNN